MYSAAHPVVTPAMNGVGGTIIDGSGTINPAALNTPGQCSPRPSVVCDATDHRDDEA